MNKEAPVSNYLNTENLINPPVDFVTQKGLSTTELKNENLINPSNAVLTPEASLRSEILDGSCIFEEIQKTNKLNLDSFGSFNSKTEINPSQALRADSPYLIADKGIFETDSQIGFALDPETALLSEQHLSNGALVNTEPLKLNEQRNFCVADSFIDTVLNEDGKVFLETPKDILETGIGKFDFGNPNILAGNNGIGSLALNNPLALPSQEPLASFEVLDPIEAGKEKIKFIVAEVVAEFFNNFKEEIKSMIGENKTKQLTEGKPKEWYDSEYGAGCIKKKKFNFNKERLPYGLFTKAFEKEGWLTREEVLEILETNDKEEDSQIIPAKNNHSIETYLINDIVKRVRKTTALTSSEFVQSGGSVRLVYEIKSIET